MISDLSFCIGRLEGTHAGLIMNNKQFEGMDTLLRVAEKINENVDVLHEWFKEQYPE
jgi:hypothetical protein